MNPPQPPYPPTPPAPQPPLIPPSLPPTGAIPSDSPEDHQPIEGVVATLEAVLRQPRRVLCHLRERSPGRLIAILLVVSILASLLYGFVIGTFSGGSQLWAAPLKTALGLLFSAAICLPSLYIFAGLSGSSARLPEVVGLVAALLALLSILLIGFAPVAWVFSQSTESLVAMGALHLAFWLIATYFALRLVDAGFMTPGGRPGGGVRVWMLIFVLVMLQMMTALRPLLGTADTLLPQQKRFFLSHWAECMRQAPK